VKVYLISSSFVWGILFLALMDSKFPVWYPYYISWTLTILSDIILLVSLCVLQKPVELFDYISISIQSLRICNLLVLICLYVTLRNCREAYKNDDTERQSLLGPKVAPRTLDSEESDRNANNYGATTESTSEESRRKADEEDDEANTERLEDEERLAKRLKDDGNWWTYTKGFAVSIHS
jgi:hypothetical protein